MFGKIATTMLLGATLITGVAAPAEARRPYYNDGYGQNYGYGYGNYDRQYRGYDRTYYRRSNYGYQHRCYDKGNGGLAIGAIAGGLLGNVVAGHGDKTLGTVLGAAGGGLLGRSIDRSDGRPC
ncbi:glycine zipper 2TM domain-containing protein [Sphingomonas sp.]|uniref:glycine zipper 2TM domain-containing protein n=1 Tax=Sphingomonas sp. TaxID=28214 RepID=UPI003B3BE347